MGRRWYHERLPIPRTWFHKDDSAWGRVRWQIRHGLYWLGAAAITAVAYFDQDVSEVNPNRDLGDLLWLLLLFISIAIASLVMTLIELTNVGASRTVSRSLVLYAFTIGFAAVVLSQTHHWGVEIQRCTTTPSVEFCTGQASPREIVGMLAWHAADIVPGLKIPKSLEWSRPARSDHAAIGVTIIVIRAWAAVGVLGIAKRIWDAWNVAPGVR